MNTLTPSTTITSALAAATEQADAYAHWLSPSTSNAWILLPVLRLLTGAAARLGGELERQALRG